VALGTISLAEEVSQPFSHELAANEAVDEVGNGFYILVRLKREEATRVWYI